MLNLVVGFGNPEPEWKNTRHQIGQMVLDQLWPLNWKKEKEFHYQEFGNTVYLKPMECINLSGETTKKFLEFSKLVPDRILIVVDESLLVLGDMKLKKEGNPSRHNGIRNMIKEFGNDGFDRLRVGIGPKPPTISSLDYVLQDFSAAERLLLTTVKKSALIALLDWSAVDG